MHEQATNTNLDCGSLDSHLPDFTQQLFLLDSISCRPTVWMLAANVSQDHLQPMRYFQAKQLIYIEQFGSGYLIPGEKNLSMFKLWAPRA